ncbi:MAG: PorV/PorQ family protein, partial [bacterium]
QWLAGINTGFLGYVHPFGKAGTMGASITYLDYGTLLRTTDSFEPVGTFKASDQCLNFAYAYPFKGLSLGGNLKFIQRAIYSESAFALGIDLGAFYILREKMRAGFCIQNVGTEVKFDAEGDPLPVNIKAGISYRILRRSRHQLLAAMDWAQPIDNKFRSDLGIEYWFKNTLCIRAGYRLNYDTDWMTAGLSVRVKGCQLDYAYQPFKFLEATHRASLSYAWGKVMVKEPGAAKKIKKKMTRSEILSGADDMYKNGEIQGAIVLWKKVLKKDKKNAKIKNKIEEAEKKIVQLKKGDHFNRGVALFENGEYKKAVREWKEVLKFDPDHAESKRLIAKTKAMPEKKKPEKEKKNKGKEEAEKLMNEADEKYKNGEIEKAITLWKKALKKDKKNVEIKNKIEEAEKKNAQIKKGDHFNTAVKYFEQKEYKKAIKEWKEVLKIDPAHAESKRLIEKAKKY